MDNREALKSMLNNLINDRSAEAELDIHGYFTSKMRDIAGLNTAPVVDEPVADVTDEPSTDEAPATDDAVE